jgi:hypothetical protein
MNTPIILIEVVLVFGGVLLFGWWQLRSIKRDQQQAAEQRQRQHEDEMRAGQKRAGEYEPDQR